MTEAVARSLRQGARGHVTALRSSGLAQLNATRRPDRSAELPASFYLVKTQKTEASLQQFDGLTTASQPHQSQARDQTERATRRHFPSGVPSQSEA